MKVSIIAYVGEFGSGKTLYATYTGIRFLIANPTSYLYTNYPLKNLGELAERWKQYSFKDISQNILPKWIKNGLMIIDEIQEGADAYDFMRNEVRQKSRFVNQIRKNDLELIMITPNLDFVSSRLRKVITHFAIMEEMTENGVVKAHWWKRIMMSAGFTTVKKYVFEKNLTAYFQNYDSKYIIEDNSEDEDEQVLPALNKKKPVSTSKKTGKPPKPKEVATKKTTLKNLHDKDMQLTLLEEIPDELKDDLKASCE